jgi:hypothetical protein
MLFFKSPAWREEEPSRKPGGRFSPVSKNESGHIGGTLPFFFLGNNEAFHCFAEEIMRHLIFSWQK